MTASSTTPRDTYQPSGKWEFDEGVTAVFDDMLARSIPNYEQMRALTTSLALEYARPRQGRIVDLGCSRGRAIEPVARALGNDWSYLGVEVSEPMRAAARETLKPWIDAGVADVVNTDLRHDFPSGRNVVVMSVLTLQFTPIEYRQNIVQAIYDSLEPGGAFLLVEKILADGAHLDERFVDLYYRVKGEHGYDEESVARKKAALEGVLVPVTAGWNEHLLRTAGFRHVDCYWRTLNFAGWVAVKA